MAEKGVLVADAITGESIGCYDSVETDDDSNARVIQIVDLCQRKHGFNVSAEGTTGGKIRAGVTTSDSTSMSTIPTAITSSMLTVGDKTTLVVVCHSAIGSSENKITITPIVIDSNSAMIGFLTPKIASSFMPDGGTSIDQPFWKSGTYYTSISEVLSWDVLGAEKIGIHVACDSTDGSIPGTVDVYASMITGPGTGVAAATAAAAGTYTNYLPSGEP